MKNTLQFKLDYDFNTNTTIYSNKKCISVCDMDIFYIKVDNEENKGLKITKIAKCVMIYQVNDDTLFIVGLDDCKSMTVKGDGKVTMTVEI